MTPRAVVRAALDRGLDLIAITDHNTAAMTPAVSRAAHEMGLAFLYGLELQTRENVHLLAYFDQERPCLEFSEEVFALLPDSTEDPYGLGEQRQVDIEGRLIRIESRFLVNGIDLSFSAAAQRVYQLGGLPVPAHVDRELFGVLSALGALPRDVDFPLIEVRGPRVPPLPGEAKILRTSDAHDLEDIGRRVTYITFARPSISELRQAILGQAGRGLTASPPECDRDRSCEEMR